VGKSAILENVTAEFDRIHQMNDTVADEADKIDSAVKIFMDVLQKEQCVVNGQ